MENGNHALSLEEKEQFWRQGYLGPYKLCSSEENAQHAFGNRDSP